MRRPVTTVSTAVALALLPLASCGAQDETLTVLAAASLTESFTELAAEFEETHPGIEVRLSFGSSSTLARQAVDGAPGAVLATADEQSMQVAVDGAVVVEGPHAFATNTLVVATPPGNPAGIEDIADLDEADVDYVACAGTAPCGDLAVQLLADASVDHPPVSEEVDVKAVLARVVAGEADAGLVYRTDAMAAGGDVETVRLPDAAPRTTYPIALLTEDETAQGFLDLVLGEQGRTVLARAGFGEVSRGAR